MKHFNVGLIGGGFMAKAHSLAYAAMPMFFWPAPAVPVRKAVADVNLELATEAKHRFGFEKAYGDWRELIADPEIDIVDIVTPNHLHAEMAIAAAEAGKHILCEKPLARTAAEARSMLEAVEKAGVTHMVAFNYRRTPAVVLAKKFIDEGRIGKILSFRGTYLQDWSADPDSPLSWRFQKKVAGSGALGDIAAHVIDMARYLVGDFESVNAMVKTWIPERPVQQGGLDKLGTVKGGADAPKGPVDVDDEVNFLIRFASGAIGSIESTRNAHGRNNFITFEIHGERGSIFFNYERRDELQVCFADDPVDAKGFRTIYTGPMHPYGEGLWPIPALGIGYTETKIVECYDFMKAVVDGTSVSPNFRDGYEIARICDAVLLSGERNEWVDVSSVQ
ncbi:MAG: Gfo/Idh/MocA family oxidoreductase [Alicyclobacillus sp.]|nr:Gfo/Idh/MocA family oxidoreductase [Alicyclobacillus sp.]